MEHNFLKSLLSLFKNEEEQRVDFEWKQITEQMRVDTENIRKYRENYNENLQMAKTKLLRGRKDMQDHYLKLRANHND